MLTDAPPRNSNRAGFIESEGIGTLDLPQDGCLLAIAKSLESAMKEGENADIRNACAEFLAAISEFYRTHLREPAATGTASTPDAAWTFTVYKVVWHLSGLTRLLLCTRHEVVPGPEGPS